MIPASIRSNQAAKSWSLSSCSPSRHERSNPEPLELVPSTSAPEVKQVTCELASVRKFKPRDAIYGIVRKCFC